MAHQRGRRLEEDRGVGGHVEAQLPGMIRVVERQAKDLAGGGDGGQKPDVGLPVSASLGIHQHPGLGQAAFFVAPLNEESGPLHRNAPA